MHNPCLRYFSTENQFKGPVSYIKEITRNLDDKRDKQNKMFCHKNNLFKYRKKENIDVINQKERDSQFLQDILKVKQKIKKIPYRTNKTYGLNCPNFGVNYLFYEDKSCVKRNQSGSNNSGKKFSKKRSLSISELISSLNHPNNESLKTRKIKERLRSLQLSSSSSCKYKNYFDTSSNCCRTIQSKNYHSCVNSNTISASKTCHLPYKFNRNHSNYYNYNNRLYTKLLRNDSDLKDKIFYKDMKNLKKKTICNWKKNYNILGTMY